MYISCELLKFTLFFEQTSYICSHRLNERMIYTFDPYANQAPASWQLNKIYSWNSHNL